eukprot:TRINITY_DN2593_c0_g1_i5.p1 TRINITY_DN2593_c0_g1~~TRINITY_DN2593_c0_g1_i5.p1  ORF type:complete len:257 (+),score=33.23 TRINITY_DN2593_c0_g1_i5:749-1519(+)
MLLDGLTNNNSYNLLGRLSAWFQENKKRKEIIISSLPLSIKSQDLMTFDIQTFLMPSWSLLEYRSAILDKDFYTSIQHFLDVFKIKDEDQKIDEDQVEFEKPKTPTELLDMKFFYAGGSARWMFSYSTKSTRAEIQDHIQRIDDPKKLITGLGGVRSDHSVNHLMMGFGNFENHNYFLISEYASRIVSEKCENEFVIMATSSRLAKENPTFDGWIFECDFFTQLRKADRKFPLEVYDVDETKFVSLEVLQCKIFTG